METFISTEVIHSEAYKQARLRRQPGNLVLRTVRAPPAAHQAAACRRAPGGGPSLSQLEIRKRACRFKLHDVKTKRSSPHTCFQWILHAITSHPLFLGISSHPSYSKAYFQYFSSRGSTRIPQKPCGVLIVTETLGMPKWETILMRLRESRVFWGERMKTRVQNASRQFPSTTCSCEMCHYNQWDGMSLWL